MKHDRNPFRGSSEMMLGDLELAIIGCGAIAELLLFSGALGRRRGT